ncbi:MAG: glycosyltransferase [Planctomycetota bacterium]
MSFVVPAHDEEAALPATLAAIAEAASGLRYEIVVVDDASTDRTGAIARAAGAVVVRVEHRQISRTRNAGAAVARGRVLVFVDADTRVTPAVLAAVRAAVEDGAIGGGARIAFDAPVPRWAKTVAPAFTRLYRAFGLAAGCFLFCTRDAFLAVGGFDEAMFAGEEVQMSRALRRFARAERRRGRTARFTIVAEAVVTSARKLRQFSGWTLLRTIAWVGFAGRRGVRDRRRLDLWYAPRRPDPAPPAAPDGRRDPAPRR